VISTDIAKDGMLSGPSFELYKDILRECKMSVRAQSRTHDLSIALEETNNPLKLIASGGISTFDELPKLAEMGCEGVIIGKAIYENRISLKQLENYIINK
jgi:phosphoribosylformimino-5-aminoimidazole carboxamide ribotide isomerase